MRTLIVIVIGVVLALTFVFGANYINKGKSEPIVNGLSWFIGLWLAFCVVDFCIGVFKAGYGPLEELGVHLVVFAVPVAAAWFLSRQLFNPIHN